MSLKGFHIAFIIISTLLFIAIAAWSFLGPEEGAGIVTMGIIGLTGAIVLPAYGIYFLRKSKNLFH